VGDCISESASHVTEKRGKEHVHQAIVNPIVVYVPLTTQNTAKYLTELSPRTVKSRRYPTAATKDDTAMKIPLLCILSETQQKETSMMAAAA